MKVRVLFFATLRERAGERQVEMELPDDLRVAEFKEILKERYPGLGQGMPSALVAINKELAFDQQSIPDGAEVAVFPPVSGG